MPSKHDDADVRRVGVWIGAVRAPELLVAAADEQMTAGEASPGQVGPVARPARHGEGARAQIDDTSGRAEAETATARCDDHRRGKIKSRPRKSALAGRSCVAACVAAPCRQHRDRREDRNRLSLHAGIPHTATTAERAPGSIEATQRPLGCPGREPV